jgi:ubiquinone/menaquinone biosynthesis C-methylase UbiE
LEFGIDHEYIKNVMKLPDKNNIYPTNMEDPLKYYFLPVLGALFRKRLEYGLQLLGRGPYQRILEIGYGSGILFPELNERCEMIVGVDNHRSPDLVKEMMKRENIEASLTVGDILNLSYASDSFDAVVCLSVLEHIKDLDRAIGEIVRVLKPGGRAIYGFPTTNKIMMSLLTLIGAPCIDKRHISGPREIRRVVNQQMSSLSEKWFPSILPREYSLYIVLHAIKGGSNDKHD